MIYQKKEENNPIYAYVLNLIKISLHIRQKDRRHFKTDISLLPDFTCRKLEMYQTFILQIIRTAEKRVLFLY